MTDSLAPGGVLDRLAAAPSRTAGVVAAALALAMMLIGAVVLPEFFIDPPPAEGYVALSELAAYVRTSLLAGALAMLGFVPLLFAIHALIANRAKPAGLVLAAYLTLLVHPLALVVEASVYPNSILSPLDPVGPYLLLAMAGLAAGLASAAILPLAQAAASPIRRAVLAGSIGLLVSLAIYSFAPFIAPLSALGVGAALLMGRRSAGGHDPSNGPAGEH